MPIQFISFTSSKTYLNALLMPLLALILPLLLLFSCGVSTPTPQPTTTYTITFNTDGGNTIAAQQIEAGKKATKPADPIKPGNIFKGWYKEITLNNLFNFVTEAITGNIKLYAKWEAITVVTTYTVTFNTDGGNTIATQQVEAGKKVTKPADPTWANNTFLGWYKEVSFTNPFDFDAVTITGDITLYARWVAEGTTIYTVSFDSGEGSAVVTQQVEAGEKVTKPAGPTWANNTFLGWYKEVSFTNPFDFDAVAINNNITLYAKWVAEGTTIYTVTFDSGKGSAVGVLQVEAGGKVTKPADPTRADYTFVGWYKEATFTNAFDFDATTITGDITLYAKWVAEGTTIYTVTFDSGGGSAVGVLQVEAGEKITKPADPARADYTFAGWYKEVSFTNPFDFDTVAINSNITLYAKWVAEGTTIYTVTFDSGEGSAVGVLQVEAGGRVTKPADPTRVDYTFAGWYKEVSFTNPFDFDTVAINSNITLYAKWVAEGTTIYTVSFDSGEGSVIGVLQVEAGEKITKPTDPTRADYTFAGWYKEVSFTNPFDFDAVTITGDITLYAKWVAEGTTIYTVSFDSGEGSAIGILQVEAGKKITKPTDPTRAGYTFVSWYKEATFANAFDFDTATITGDITLYAKWVAEGTTIYTVSFDSGEGSAVGVLQVEAGEKITKPTDPTRAGYTFAGWYKEVSFTNPFDFDTVAINSNITLYAKWVAEGTTIYTVSFDSGEGSVIGVLQVEAGEKITKPTDPTRADYTFAGWYKEVSFTNPFDFDAVTITGDITLYAKWVAEGTTIYTVSFDSGEGSAIGILQVEAGKKITKPTDPTRAGYTFVSWYKEATFANAFDFDTATITGDITLYAKWVAEGTTIYTVSFDSGEGSAVGVLQVEAGEKITKPTDPTRAGYTFAGWYKEVSFTNPFDFDTATITGDITLYAKWVAEGTTIYTVSFDSGEGSAIGILQVEAGEKITKPTDPTRAGYTFVGWYKEAVFANAFDFDTVTITGDITLYAKWVAEGTIIYTVSFDSGEGSAVATLQVEEGGKVTKPTDPTRADYTFVGWYKEVAFANAFNFEAETITGNITLYAKWLPEGATYTVTFDSREGSAVAELKVEAGKQATKPATPTRTDYTFVGWYKEVAFTNVFDFDTETIIGDITLYAKWEALPKFTVSFDLNYEGGVNSLAPQEIVQGKGVTKPTDPEREDYTFVGWYKEVAFTNAFDFDTATITGDITLYAKWEALPKFTVSFDLNYEGGVNPLAPQEIVQGKGVTKPTDPEREDYTFVGWYKEVAFTNVFDFDTETIIGDITLYAKWEAIVYTVTFVRIGYWGPAERLGTKELLSGTALELNKYEKYPYLIAYLATDENGNQKFDEKSKITSDMTLYVNWLARPETKDDLIKLIDDAIATAGSTADLNFIDTQLIKDMRALFDYLSFNRKSDFNGDISRWNVAAVTNMNYMFGYAIKFNGDISGWNVDAVTDMRQMFFNANAFKQDLESWGVDISVQKDRMFDESGLQINEDAQPSWYLPKLTFVTGVVGIDVPPIYLLAGGMVNEPFLPTRAGYSLQHWSTSEENGEAFDFNQAITEDITLYAKWQEVSTVVVTFQRLGARGPKEFLGEQYVTKDQPLDPKLFVKSPYSFVELFTDSDETEVFDQKTPIISDMMFYVKWLVRPGNKQDLIIFIDEAIQDHGSGANLNFIDTSLITDMSDLFRKKELFTGDISGWNVAAVTDMRRMFFNASTFNGDISGWNVAAVTDMSYMFFNATYFYRDISKWNVASSVNVEAIFAGSGLQINEDAQPSWYLPKLTFVHGPESTSVSPIYVRAGQRVTEVPSPTRVDYVFKHWSISEEGDEAFDFNQPITTDITLYAKWEEPKLSVTFIRLGDRGPELGVQQVAMDQPLSPELFIFEDSPYVLDGLFRDSFENEHSGFDIAIPIVDKTTLYVKWLVRPKSKEMLINLIRNEINNVGNNEDLNFIDTQLITDMSNLFSASDMNRFNGDISKWNVAAVTDMNNMFNDASSFNGDISGWNVDAVTDMSKMFFHASTFNQNLDQWNVAESVYKVDMFANSGMTSRPSWY